MFDLVFRGFEGVVHSHCCPGVNHLRDGTALLHGAPPAGSTWELHPHQQQQVIPQRDGDRRGAEGWSRQTRGLIIHQLSINYLMINVKRGRFESLSLRVCRLSSPSTLWPRFHSAALHNCSWWLTEITVVKLARLHPDCSDGAEVNAKTNHVVQLEVGKGLGDITGARGHPNTPRDVLPRVPGNRQEHRLFEVNDHKLPSSEKDLENADVNNSITWPWSLKWLMK